MQCAVQEGSTFTASKLHNNNNNNNNNDNKASRYVGMSLSHARWPIRILN